MAGQVWPLVVFAAVSTVTPGGATAIATASGARWGFRRSMPVLAGIAAGLAAMAACAGAGLAGVMLAQPSLVLAMKVAGSAYLVWLAQRTARAGAPGQPAGGARPAGFVAGAGMLWSNPKGWAMTVSAGASFASMGGGPSGLAVLLGTTFGVMAAASLSLWCVAGQVLARVLRTERQWRALNAALAALLLASVVPVWL